MEPKTDRLVLHQLARLTEPVQAGITWPVAVYHRSEDLIGRVSALRGKTERSLLAAALVFAAPESAEELRRIIDAYWGATVRQALLDVPARRNIVDRQRRRSGPR